MPLERVIAEDERPEPIDTAPAVVWDKKQMLGEWKQSVARTNIAYRWRKDGRVECHLTLTFPGNTTFRFSADADPRTIVALMREQHPHVAGFSLKKLAKGIGKVAKKVASVKVFKVAADALKKIAPIAGTLMPALGAASVALSATTKLLAAKKHAAAGNKEAAKQLVDSAAADAKQAPAEKGGQPAALNAANAHAQKIYTLLLRPV